MEVRLCIFYSAHAFNKLESFTNYFLKTIMFSPAGKFKEESGPDQRRTSRNGCEDRSCKPYSSSSKAQAIHCFATLTDGEFYRDVEIRSLYLNILKSCPIFKGYGQSDSSIPL